MFGWGAQEINGIPQPNGSRVVSFFKDEPIAGAYLNGFIFLILGYLFTKIKKDKLKNFFIYYINNIFIFISSYNWRKIKFNKSYIWYYSYFLG